MSVTENSNSLGPFVTAPVAAPVLQWAPNLFPGVPPAPNGSDWVDISSYLISADWQRGRQYEADEFQAGTMTLVLDNSGRDFDPTYLGPAGDGNGLGTLAKDYLNNPTTWTNSELLPMRRFKLSLFFPDPTGALNNQEGLAPGTQSVWPLMVGYVEGFPPTWEGTDYSTVTLTCTDGFLLMQNSSLNGASNDQSTNFTTTDSFGGSGAISTLVAGLSGQQIVAVLDAMGWPGLGLYQKDGARNIDQGLTQCAQQQFSGTSSSDALSVIQAIEQTELGQFFIAADGSATFHDRQHRRNTTRSTTSQGTFSDQS